MIGTTAGAGGAHLVGTARSPRNVTVAASPPPSPGAAEPPPHPLEPRMTPTPPPVTTGAVPTVPAVPASRDGARARAAGVLLLAAALLAVAWWSRPALAALVADPALGIGVLALLGLAALGSAAIARRAAGAGGAAETLADDAERVAAGDLTVRLHDDAGRAPIARLRRALVRSVRGQRRLAVVARSTAGDAATAASRIGERADAVAARVRETARTSDALSGRAAAMAGDID